MLKIRIIPTLLYKNHGLVKGVGFDSWRRVGTALPAVKVYCTREVDELVLVDISATRDGHLIDISEVDAIADECFMPLTVGGGVRTVRDFQQLLRAGADKVAVNTAAVQTPELISAAASAFGAQCVVVSIDYRTHASGRREIYTHSGTRPTGIDPVAFARDMERLGAGEILFTSIDLDGTFRGYDLDGIRAVSEAVSVPIIASGGCGEYEHMRLAITEGRASAVAAASVFHFTHLTPLQAKRHLASHGLPVRL